ncbi:hypothetical protein [Streptococcus plurextorum]|uniref:hypothetical protein n=1 Tax=Streptococcus plurextorum TaxID=456876 RepID=UPI000401A56A|nr:hypothetical protein [Streptococcus plurextorum]
MSLASEAILEIEGQVANRLKEHEEAIALLGQQVDSQLAEAEKASRQALLAHKEARQRELAATIADKEAQANARISEKIAELSTSIVQKEPVLVASILEEVQEFYGGI